MVPTVGRAVVLAWSALTAVLVLTSPTALGWAGTASTVSYLALGSALTLLVVHAAGRPANNRLLAAIAGLCLSLGSLVVVSMVLLQLHVWTPDRVAVGVVVETALLACLPTLWTTGGGPSHAARPRPSANLASPPPRMSVEDPPQDADAEPWWRS